MSPLSKHPRKTQLDYSASVAKKQAVSRASTPWVWHVCQRDRGALGETQGPLQEDLVKWKAGTLRGDKFDVETNLWFLARRLVPLHVLKEKLDVYIAEGHTAAHEKDHHAQVFETMFGQQREPNLHGAHDLIMTEEIQRGQCPLTSR